MTGEQFRQMMREELENLLALNERKGGDYAGEEDALAHLKQRAKAVGVAPEQVWAVFAGKHWEALMSAVRNVDNPDYDPSEPIEERVRDLMVYLFLYMALVRWREEEDAKANLGAPSAGASDQGGGDAAARRSGA